MDNIVLKPKISVILPTFNRAVLLTKSLASLVKQTVSKDEFELVVIDDGSTDNTKEVCDQFSDELRLVYLHQKNAGISIAKNNGVQAAMADLLLFFDDDDVADPKLIEEHLKSHAEFPDEKVAVLGYTGWDSSVTVDAVMEYIVGKGGFLFCYGRMKSGQFYDYTYFWGGRSSCKRQLLLKHGLFNPVFTFGSEDIELGYRLSSLGFKVLYNEAARSYMIRPLTFEGVLARCQRQGKSQVWFSRLHTAPEVQRWCQRPKAEGIWDFMKIDFEKNIHTALYMTKEVNAFRRTVNHLPFDHPDRKKLQEMIDFRDNLYWKVFTAAKYKGIVEEVRRLEGSTSSIAEKTAPSTHSVSSNDGRKRVLFIEIFLPFFDRASGSFRTFQLLKTLRELDYDVTFISRSPLHEEEYAPYLERMGIEVIAGDPLALQANFDYAVCPLVDYEKVLGGRRWDLAIVLFWDNAEYYLPILRKYLPGTPIVVDTVDIVFLRKMREAKLYSAPELMAETLTKKQKEIAVYRQADRLWVVTEADGASVQDFVPGMPIDVVPNIHPPIAEQKGFAGTKDLLFVGNFWHMPNVDAVDLFCGHIFPLIHAKRPDICIQIVGGNLPKELRRHESEFIKFLGHVPELAPFLRSARVSVAPLRYGAGMKGKIGEALSWGLPVVTTKIGAEGMDLVHGETAMIADTPEDFANAVLQLYDDEALWTKLSVNGKAKVESNWGSEAVKHRVADVVDKAIKERLIASIIILTYNQLEHTRRCVESLLAHTAERVELIFVDNASTDGTREYLAELSVKHKFVRVIFNKTNRGFAAGNNQGLSIARGEAVVLLNNDTVVTPGWLTNMLAVLDRHPEVGLVGPVSNNVSGPQRISPVEYQTLEELPAYAEKRNKEFAGQSELVVRLVGFCLLARQAVIKRIGGLDEKFGSGNFEDDDFCLRAADAGFNVRIAADSFVHHVGGQTFKGANIDYRKAMLRNWAIFRDKWQLPVKEYTEQGYPTPNRLPVGVSLRIPLPSLSVTHQLGEDRSWREKGESEVRELMQLPPVAKIGSLDSAYSRLKNKEFREAWEETLAAIQVRPFHPEAFLLLAEIAKAAGDIALARRCAKRGKSLTPDWKFAHFLKSIAKMPDNVKVSTTADWPALPEPPASSRLTVCLIAKNEENFLGQCLESIRSVAQQIVVVDTGSTDRTVEIAKEHGAEVHFFTWNDDFSAARNAALEHARGDWILVLDADEELIPEGQEAIRKEIADPKVMAYRMPLLNEGLEQAGCGYVPRLFRNAAGLFFKRRVHEQISETLEPLRKMWGLDHRLGTATLLHHGYRLQLIWEREKIARNIKLLEMALKEKPDDVLLVMNLGLEFTRDGKREEGLEKYWEAFHLLTPQKAKADFPELTETLLTQFCCQLMTPDKFKELEYVLTSPLSKVYGLTATMHYLLGLAFLKQERFAESVEEMRRCLAKCQQPTLVTGMMEARSDVPHHCLALALIQLKQYDAARKAFLTGLKEHPESQILRSSYAEFLAAHATVAEAFQVLQEGIQQQPTVAEFWETGGKIALGRPETYEVAEHWTAEAVRLFPEHLSILQQRATALLLRGKLSEAQSFWEQVKEGFEAEKEAALVICGILTNTSLPASLSAQEADVSREFLKWYRLLISAGQTSLVVKLNGQLGQLRSLLPMAVSMLETALREAQPASS